MITGIGTPSSQSRIPRPIISSISFLIDGKTWKTTSCSFESDGTNRQELDEGFLPGLPVSGVRHRGPRLGRPLRVALLQKLDRMQILRAHEGHLAIARRAVDGDTHFLQAVAGRVDVVDLVGEVAEIAVLAVFLLIPIVGKFDQRRAPSLGGF